MSAKHPGQCCCGDCCADWPIDIDGVAQCRYFFVDNINGNDANVGYIDAPVLTVFGAGVGLAVALKTEEELRARLPRDGAGRRAKILEVPRIVGGVAQNYLNKAGASDYRDIGYHGYAWIGFFASDLTNSANDRCDMGGIIAAVGPNVDGSWTASGAQVNWTITNAAGVLPAQDTIAGYKLQYKGNVTAALRTSSNMVIARSANTIFDVAVKIASPGVANLDEYFLMTPALMFTTIVNDGIGVNGPEQQFFSGVIVAGTRFTAAINGRGASSQKGGWISIFNRFDAAVSFDSSIMPAQMPANYLLEDMSTSRPVFASGDYRAAFVSNGPAPTSFCSAFHAATTFASQAGPGSDLLNACYSLLRPTIQNHGTPSLFGVNGPAIGSVVAAVFRPSKLVAGLEMRGCCATIGLIDCDGAVNGIVVTGVGGTLQIGVSGTGGPSGTVTTSGIDCSAAKGFSLLVESTSLVGTVQDVLMQGGIVASFASLATSPQWDNMKNVIQGSAGVPVKKTVLKFSGMHAADVTLAVASYLADPGLVAAGALAGPVNYPMPACRVRNLRVKPTVNTLAVPMTVTVFKNGVASAVTVTVLAGSVLNVSDTTHEEQFSADDEFDLRADSTAGGAGAVCEFAATLECY